MVTFTVNKFFLFLIILSLVICSFIRFLVIPVLECLLEYFEDNGKKTDEKEDDRST